MCAFWKKRTFRVRDNNRTPAAELTLRQSLYPICLVTILFFLWGFSYGLLDTLNKHFQNTLGISKARSSGLQAAYFGHSEIRINISQAFNGVGSVVAPVLGSYVLFDFDDQRALQNVQWIYTAIAIFVFGLGLIFFVSTIPEITDADMEYQSRQTNDGENDMPLRKHYRLFHAAFAQFCYCGSQVAIAGYFINYVTETRPGTDSSLGSKFLAGAQAAFAVGRFFGVFLMHFFRPRWIYGIFMTMCIVFLAPSITQKGNTGMSMLYITLFFESICFPTIVALGMRGLGRHTKRGSGFIIGGVIGGACVPPLLGATADLHSTAFAMVVPLCFFVVSWSYPLCVNFVPSYRDCVDAYTTTDVGVQPHESNVDEEKTSKPVVQLTEEL
ncbi:L-fucose-proton symporter [Penicillium subrubescens]|uniref:L-fucose-proton symporter n=1 Tax=Penicillium subrubescens TaxID=1316194 RepID=A0A1Q5TXK6_9EURO|nr:L-fucose-proton symporter [Penicillium subrubescens]